jgi:hypothetical protein
VRSQAVLFTLYLVVVLAGLAWFTVSALTRM